MLIATDFCKSTARRGSASSKLCAVWEDFSNEKGVRVCVHEVLYEYKLLNFLIAYLDSIIKLFHCFVC